MKKKKKNPIYGDSLKVERNDSLFFLFGNESKKCFQLLIRISNMIFYIHKFHRFHFMAALVNSKITSEA